MEGMVPGRQGTDWPACGVMEGMAPGRWAQTGQHVGGHVGHSRNPGYNNA